ncbi:MAG: imidazole glycerol phosphate synthase subunit HisH [Deltaproteobacteria bacterium]|nr:imidazole glycerol phosphate synthase subunit HisH [Deltaproteobacteria bacterium]
MTALGGSGRNGAIGVVDYGMGNLRSVSKALESLGFPTAVSGDPAVLSSCRGIVFPGVGAFRDCMGNVVRQGLLPFLADYLASGGPFLGICVGMQLLFAESEEFGRHEGIGFFPGKVVRFPADMPAEGGGVLKVPHMGWNGVEILSDHPVLEGIPSGTYFYFVHSYYAVPSDPGITGCRTTYGVPFAAAVGSGNRFAVQFHPEKSQAAGLRLLGNFGRLCSAA